MDTGLWGITHVVTCALDSIAIVSIRIVYFGNMFRCAHFRFDLVEFGASKGEPRTPIAMVTFDRGRARSTFQARFISALLPSFLCRPWRHLR